MRALLLITVIFFSLHGLQAQTVVDDFEGNGTITTWYGDACAINTALSNPVAQGINSSATVLEYHDQGGQYANIGFDVAGVFDLAEEHTFTLKVFVPSSGITGQQNNQIAIKLQDGSLPEPWTTQCEIIKSIVLDQWQVVTFDFDNDVYVNLDPNSGDPLQRDDFSRVLFQLNGENNNDEVLAYLDDVHYDGTIDSSVNGGGGGQNPVFNHLIWADEFDGNGMIDTSNWFHQTLLPNGSSWFNNEVQHYTDRIENAYVAQGMLHVVAKKESYTDQGVTKAYTSARLNSKFAFTHGRVEVKAKLPFGEGTWPAIWMLGKNITENGGYWASQYGTVGWPACGEIDIMEHWGINQNYVQSALHTPSSFGGTVNHGGLALADVSNTFHVYAVDWYSTHMDFSVDGSVFYTYTPDPQNMETWPFVADQYILLNVAMQGNIDPAFTESDMVIDYVRVYQEAPSGLRKHDETKGLKLFPNPARDVLQLEIPFNVKGAAVYVYDFTGKEWLSLKDRNDLLTLDVSDLPRGIYTVTVVNEEQRMSARFAK